MITVKVEKYGEGKYNVYTTGDFPRRVGHIIGAKDTWEAEMGPTNLGFFKTKKAAIKAIENGVNLLEEKHKPTLKQVEHAHRQLFWYAKEHNLDYSPADDTGLFILWNGIDIAENLPEDIERYLGFVNYENPEW